MLCKELAFRCLPRCRPAPSVRCTGEPPAQSCRDPWSCSPQASLHRSADLPCALISNKGSESQVVLQTVGVCPHVQTWVNCARLYFFMGRATARGRCGSSSLHATYDTFPEQSLPALGMIHVSLVLKHKDQSKPLGRGQGASFDDRTELC